MCVCVCVYVRERERERACVCNVLFFFRCEEIKATSLQYSPLGRNGERRRKYF